MSKCKYYRENTNLQYTPECSDRSIHPQDIRGDYCQYCGREIKIKEFTELPQHIMDRNLTC